MVVCKYYQQGNCRFGDKCRYDHPGAVRSGDSGATNPPENRFGIFGRGTSSNEGRAASTPYGIKTTDIRDDLTAGKGRPQWILSTYGPAKNAPASLLEGSEFSFEELRLRFYELASQGNQQLANEEANGLWAKNEAAIQEIVHKVDNVAKFIEEAEGRHPNRHDLCKIDGSKSIDQVKEEFQNGIPGGFGHSSSSGGVSTPFTQPTTAPAFGQRSGFGQPIGSTPSFGKPTQPGTFGQPAFGQPSAPSQAPAFGEPSRPQPAPAFGQPSQPSGFGQPSKPPGFGQPAFGQPSQPSQPSTFGTSNPFVKSPNSAAGAAPAFGQPSAPGNTFGQPSFGAAGSGHAVPAFGRPTTSGGGFGQPSQPQSTSAPSYPFGRPPIEQFNPFNTSSQPGPTTTTTTNNQAPTAGGSFGQPPAPTSGLSPTNGPAPKTTTGANHPLTGQPSAAITYTQTLPNVPSTTRQVTDSVTKRPKTILVTYKGCKVEYKEDKPCYQRPDGKGFERIFFPDGEPVVRKEDVEPDQSKYTDEVVDAYTHLYANGGFDPSRPMPSVPPKMEWDAFDF